ncbi:MAG: putative basic amino acid antiporter YfcC [Wenzhouxiangella sp.]|nr:putative basic amino acid antiporter YfcC [Wenzhouxiangella sp.]MCH8476633.1 putative basic amino acid antiporter YfcC [Wenzhouxiangella sp.]TVR97074.1 MAG: putative basic amino acid antiporter YfcC [Wenzhouxiangellaceae bacterium]
MTRPNRQTPDTLVILFWIALVMAAASFLVPAGSFEVATDADGRTLPVALSSFSLSAEGAPGTPLFAADPDAVGFLNAPFEGLVSGSRHSAAIGIMGFLLIVGGAFGVIMQTGCIDRGVRALIRRTEKDPIVVLPLLFFLFSLGGAIFGMSEETIAFVLLLTPIIVRLGYDAITAVLVTFVASRVGFAASWMNPFNVAIAQGIAEVPILSGAALRIAMWIVFTLVGMAITVWWARRVHRNPALSPVHDSDHHFRDQAGDDSDAQSFTARDALALILLAAGVGWVIWGVMARQYFIPEIAAQFFTMGLAVGLLYLLPGANRLGANRQARAFREGAAGLIPAILVVGLAKGLVLLLGGTDPAQPSVLNTILFVLASGLTHVPELISAWLMFFVQSLINFLVPSGSGQAALTMPLMAPLGDLVGVQRQVTVLCFQLGDSLTNLIIPTSATLMGVLGAARIDWAVWARWILPILGIYVALAMTFIGVAVISGYH